MKGILGKKIGMTQVFDKSGKLIPVTVIEVEPNVVTQIKTVEHDGYDAIQLGAKTIREKLASKPSVGHTKKANTEPKRYFREVRGVDTASYTLGQELRADVFEVGETVDVTGTSKGKGYQGVIKRWNQHRGPMGHGSQYHRGVGSLGTMRPMHVLKGKKLPGHMGNVKRTVQNLIVVSVDLENNLLLVKGNVPGAKGSLVFVKEAVKGQKKVAPIELVSYIEEEVTEVSAEEVAENVEETVVVEETTEEKVEEATEEVSETEEVKEEVAEEQPTEEVSEEETPAEENTEVEEG